MRVRSKHNSKQIKRVQVVLVSFLVIGLLMLMPRIISAVSSVVMYPFHATAIWLDESSSLVPVFIRDRTSLEEQIASLENELVIAGKTDLTQQRLLEENNYLRNLLGSGTEVRTAAAVIARPNELPYDFLQIDRGSTHGIEVGAPVFIGRDVVIGLVAYTAAQYSFVELITTPGFEAFAFITGPNVAVTMEGVGGGVARVRVPQGIALTEGSLVYLPSVEPGVFGRISYIENRPTQPEQYGYITPDIAMSGLHTVSVGQLSQISRSVEEIDEQVSKIIKKQLLVEGISVATSTPLQIIENAEDIDNLQETQSAPINETAEAVLDEAI